MGQSSSDNNASLVQSHDSFMTTSTSDFLDDVIISNFDSNFDQLLFLPTTVDRFLNFLCCAHHF